MVDLQCWVKLNDLRGLFQSKQFYDSVISHFLPLLSAGTSSHVACVNKVAEV